MNERTNLLVDYFRKFIRKTRAVVESNLRSKESLDLSNETQCDFELEWRENLSCLESYIDYLERKKQSQFAGLKKAFEMIFEYFKKATEKCEGVAEREHCVKLVVSDASY